MKHVLLLIFTCAMLAGCVSTDYSSYEGSPIYTGSGGAKKVIDGVDIWESGSPPRRYRVIGMVKDSRGAGVIMGNGYGAMAAQARAHGGDAIIILGSNVQNVGSYTAPTYAQSNTTVTPTYGGAYGTQAYNAQTQTNFYGGGTTQLYRRNTGAAIIKYM